MAQYVLTDEFKLLSETSGVVVNISNVKVELSEKPEFGTGVILQPQSMVYFNNILYAACAPSDCGVAVVGVISGSISGNSIVISQDDEYISYEEIAALFGNNPPDWSQGGGDDTQSGGDDVDDGFKDYLDDLFGD